MWTACRLFKNSRANFPLKDSSECVCPPAPSPPHTLWAHPAALSNTHNSCSRSVSQASPSAPAHFTHLNALEMILGPFLHGHHEIYNKGHFSDLKKNHCVKGFHWFYWSCNFKFLYFMYLSYGSLAKGGGVDEFTCESQWESNLIPKPITSTRKVPYNSAWYVHHIIIR